MGRELLALLRSTTKTHPRRGAEQLFGSELCSTISAVRTLLVLALVCLTVAGRSLVAQPRDPGSALAEARKLESDGKPAAALEAYHWALDASQPQSLDRARALLGVATIETGQGHYADARRHAASAAELFDALGDGAQASLAVNRQGLASLAAGDYDEAKRFFSAAVDRSARAGFLEGRAEQLGNLANVYFYVGAYADASRLYDEALVLAATGAAEPWAPRRRRLLMANQAALYQRLGRDQEALALYQDLGASTDLRPRERALLLVNLGVLYRRLGDPVKALATYDQARAEFVRDHDADGELNTVKNRGIVLALDLARLDEAERSFSAAIDAATRTGNRREMLHSRLYRGETRLREGHRDTAIEDFDAALELSRELKLPEEEWKALYGLGRLNADRPAGIAHLQQAIATIEQVREDIRVPSLRAEFLNDKREVYDALISASLPDASADALFAMLERSHTRVWRERLHLDKPIDLVSVQRALPERTLLLDYWHAPQAATVVAATQSRAAVVPIKVDETAIRALVEALGAGPSSAWREQAHAVASAILPPPEWLAGIDRIVVVPDGAVALVPFDVLPSGPQLLVERAAVTYSPTAATLLRPAPATRWLPPWKLQLVGFADPVAASGDFDRASTAGRLAASSEEVRDVASELGGRAVLHVGAENRKRYLVDASARAPILHLATHALADTSALERSRIVFSAADGSGSNPDYLFLKEAYALELNGVDLAVLSACETERGRVTRAEGVQSFSRAFLAAGARATVTTMWRVADQPTADFMELFYHHLNRGEPRDKALRLAKLRFISGGSAVADPHYWAAFVLTGDGLRPVPRAVGWRMVTGGVLVVVLAGLVVASRRHRKKPVPQ